MVNKGKYIFIELSKTKSQAQKYGIIYVAPKKLQP